MTDRLKMPPSRRYTDMGTVDHRGQRADGVLTDHQILAAERVAYAASKAGCDALLRALNRFYENRRRRAKCSTK